MRSFMFIFLMMSPCTFMSLASSFAFPVSKFQTKAVTSEIQFIFLCLLEHFRCFESTWDGQGPRTHHRDAGANQLGTNVLSRQ